MLRRVDGQVAAGVPRPDDEHALALEVVGVAVRARVDLRAGERAGHVRHVLVPQVPVRDEHPVVVDALARAQGDRPSGRPDRSIGRDRHDRLDRGVEPDDLVVPVLAGVRLDVGAHLVAAREVGVLRRHREVLEEGRVARGDQVQRVVVGVPVPAHPIGLLVAVDLVARRPQLLQGGDAGRAGPDDAVAGHACRSSISSCQRITSPPDSVTVSPVMKSDASEPARIQTHRAISDGRATRPSGIDAAAASMRPVAALPGVSTHPGRDRVHPDAPRRELERRRLREHDHGGLRRPVDELARRDDEPVDRREVHDRRALAQVRQGRGHHVDHAEHVHVEHPVEELGGHRLERRRRVDAGDVRDRVDRAAEVGQLLGERGVERRPVAHVRGDRHEPAAGRVELHRRDVDGEGRPAPLQEHLGGRPAHAAAGPRDERDARVGHRIVTPPSISTSAPVT